MSVDVLLRYVKGHARLEWSWMGYGALVGLLMSGLLRKLFNPQPHIFSLRFFFSECKEALGTLCLI